MPPRKTTKAPITGATLGWDGRPIGKDESAELAEAQRKERVRERAKELGLIAPAESKAKPKPVIKQACASCHSTSKPLGFGLYGRWCEECYADFTRSFEQSYAALKGRKITSGTPPEWRVGWLKTNKERILKEGHHEFWSESLAELKELGLDISELE